ncbi:MAG: hypothetical protein H0X25_13650 [Acidobacteriales bacterium]|nr:hypothetical protein [Terriglobales bacterium]
MLPFPFAAPSTSLHGKLVAIKLAHTAVWAVMAGCILALPVVAWRGQFRLALLLSVLVLGECAVLAMNRGRCPLTDVAARYSEERGDNFDIYLPNWLARHNKQIFGTLFAASEVFLLCCWWARR